MYFFKFIYAIIKKLLSAYHKVGGKPKYILKSGIHLTGIARYSHEIMPHMNPKHQSRHAAMDKLMLSQYLHLKTRGKSC